MQDRKKLEKLVNSASSGNQNEASTASKMAVSLMIRNGINIGDLLLHFPPPKLYINGLIAIAKLYAERTTQSDHESQQLFHHLSDQINIAYSQHQSPTSPTAQKQTINHHSGDKFRNRLNRQKRSLQSSNTGSRNKTVNVPPASKNKTVTAPSTASPVKKVKPQKNRPTQKVKPSHYKKKKQPHKTKASEHFVNDLISTDNITTSFNKKTKNIFLQELKEKPSNVMRLFFVSAFFGFSIAFIIVFFLTMLISIFDVTLLPFISFHSTLLLFGFILTVIKSNQLIANGFFDR